MAVKILFLAVAVMALAVTADPVLSKRLFFECSDKAQKVCDNQPFVCYGRDQMAMTMDCEELLYFWNVTRGKWAISDRDLAGRHWCELMASDSCVFSVGHPNAGGDISPIEGRESFIGNLDIVGILTQSILDCGKSDRMEARGILRCSNFDRLFWVVGKDKFDCCRVTRPGRSKGTTWLGMPTVDR